MAGPWRTRNGGSAPSSLLAQAVQPPFSLVPTTVLKCAYRSLAEVGTERARKARELAPDPTDRPPLGEGGTGEGGTLCAFLPGSSLGAKAD